MALGGVAHGLGSGAIERVGWEGWVTGRGVCPSMPPWYKVMLLCPHISSQPHPMSNFLSLPPSAPHPHPSTQSTIKFKNIKKKKKKVREVGSFVFG